MGKQLFVLVPAIITIMGLGVISQAVAQDDTPYAKFQNTSPPLFVTSYSHFTVCTSYLFDKVPLQNFLVIFQIVDDKGVVYQINSVSLSPTSSYHSTTVPTGNYYKVEACSGAALAQAGSYTVQTFAFTDGQNPIPVSDVGNSSLRVY